LVREDQDTEQNQKENLGDAVVQPFGHDEHEERRKTRRVVAFDIPLKKETTLATVDSLIAKKSWGMSVRRTTAG
jgi:hypothetical protein